MHTFGVFLFKGNTLGFFDGDDAIFADFFHHFGDDFADFAVSSRNRCHVGNVGAIADGGGHGAQPSDEGFGTTVETAADHHRVVTSGYHFEAFGDDGLGQHGGGSGTITSDVVGFGGYFDQQAGAHVFEGVFEFDFFGDRHTVMGDNR